jgi:hypothetical protein
MDRSELRLPEVALGRKLDATFTRNKKPDTCLALENPGTISADAALRSSRARTLGFFVEPFLLPLDPSGAFVGHLAEVAHIGRLESLLDPLILRGVANDPGECEGQDRLVGGLILPD